MDSFRRDFNADGSLRSVAVQGPVADDATYDLIGLYTQIEAPVGDALDLIIGGRYNLARANADSVADPVNGGKTSLSEDFEDAVGSARFVWRVDEHHWRIFGGASQGFRAPNLSDLTRFDSARSGEFEIPSFNLDPEKFLAYEIGVRAAYEDLSLQAAYHYMNIDGLIIRQPTGALIDDEVAVAKRNAGDGFIQGVEFGASWRFLENFTVFGSAAWVEGEVDTFPTSAPNRRREPISRLAPLSGLVGLRYDDPDDAFYIEGVVQMANKADRLNTRDRADTSRIPAGGTPGYAVLSLRSGLRLSPNLSLRASLENLLDKDYRIHGSGLNEPGFNAVFSLDWRF